MKAINSTSIAEKNARENSPIYLYRIYDYDGSTDLFFAAWDSDVSFNGQTYTAFPIKHESIGENSSGAIDSVKVVVANVNRVIQAYLEAYDLRGRQVDITLVWSNQLADTSAKLTDTYYIDSYIATETQVDFTLASRFDVLDYTVPQRKFSRNYCQWKFKSAQCGYVGAETVCNKTKADCRNTKDNFARFGGFPSIPQSRVFIG